MSALALAQDAGAGSAAQARRESWRRGMYRMRQSGLSMVGLVLVVVLLVLAAVGHWIAPFPEHITGSIDTAMRFKAPSWQHWMGTNELGQDVLSLVLGGARISLFAGVAVVLLAAAVGTIVGAAAGYLGGWTDEVLSKREEVYVLAARALGAGPVRILWRHILPNIVSPVIVKMSLDVGFAVLTVASLGFVGIGVKPPTPEWGQMLSTARGFLPDYWWAAIFPGAAIFVAVLSFNLLGDGLRDVLDPKSRR